MRVLNFWQPVIAARHSERMAQHSAKILQNYWPQWPGSIHRSGERSVFHEGNGPASGPFVPPDWLLLNWVSWMIRFSAEAIFASIFLSQRTKIWDHPLIQPSLSVEIVNSADFSLESHLPASKWCWRGEFLKMRIRNLQSLLVCPIIFEKFYLTRVEWISGWRSWLASLNLNCVWRSLITCGDVCSDTSEMLGGPSLRLGILRERLSIPPGSRNGEKDTGWLVTWDCPLRADSASWKSLESFIQFTSFCSSCNLPDNSIMVFWSSMSFRLAIVSKVELWNFRNSSISVRLCWWASRKSFCWRHNSSCRIRRSSAARAAWSSWWETFSQHSAIIICLCSSSKVLINFNLQFLYLANDIKIVFRSSTNFLLEIVSKSLQFFQLIETFLMSFTKFSILFW